MVEVSWSDGLCDVCMGGIGLLRGVLDVSIPIHTCTVNVNIFESNPIPRLATVVQDPFPAQRRIKESRAHPQHRIRSSAPSFHIIRHPPFRTPRIG